MPSSALIIKKLEPTAALDVAVLVPAADIGLKTIDNTHAIVESYSPASAEEIPLGEEAAYWRKMVLWFTPLFLAFGWVAFFKAARRLKEAKSITFDLCLNALVSFTLAAGATVAIGFMLAGLAPLVPYILMSVLGLNIFQGLYYTLKHLYKAYQHKEQRSKHLKEAGKSFLGIVISSLALALNILVFQTSQMIMNGLHDFASDLFSLFMHFQDLMDLINGPVTAGVTTIKALGLGWCSAFFLSLVISACKINSQSFRLFAGTASDELTFEREAINDVQSIYAIICGKRHPSILKRAFFIITAPLTLPLYVLTGFIYAAIIRPLAALTLGIPQSLWYLFKHCCLSDKRVQRNEEVNALDFGLSRQQDRPRPQPSYQGQPLQLRPSQAVPPPLPSAPRYYPTHSQFLPEQQRGGFNVDLQGKGIRQSDSPPAYQPN